MTSHGLCVSVCLCVYNLSVTFIYFVLISIRNLHSGRLRKSNQMKKKKKKNFFLLRETGVVKNGTKDSSDSHEELRLSIVISMLELLSPPLLPKVCLFVFFFLISPFLF
jgi:hypothetical protein